MRVEAGEGSPCVKQVRNSDFEREAFFPEDREIGPQKVYLAHLTPYT